MVATACRWSARVMRKSNALDLERRVFTKRSPGAIAKSLKRSAEHSKRRKSAPFRSAMSMLNFHINRGGKSLPTSQRRVLERAKDELRKLYGRKPHAGKTASRRALSRQAHRAAGRRSASSRRASARKAARTRQAAQGEKTER